MKATMKLLMLICMLPVAAIAQKIITAESIIKRINNHEPIAISNAEITGDLDLSRLDNMKEQQQNSTDKVYISTVTIPVDFKNCTFTGKVLGYFNPDANKPYAKSSTVYNANFEGDVSFENCIFKKEVNFKYSQFDAKTSFAGSQFKDDAFFKYSKFSEGPKYNGAVFTTAVFKYVDFPKAFDFSNAIFEDAADFKYAKFEDGGSFTKAEFKNGADFKYANFSHSVSFKSANFSGSSNFKYTTLDDRQTSLSELLNK